MALNVVVSKSYKKDMKLYKNNDKVKEELKSVIEMLVSGEQLPVEKRDHALTGKLKGFRDCHIFPNIALIYKIADNELYLSRIGSHNKIGLTESMTKFGLRNHRNIRNIKLRIKEDTACIPSKTSYVDEDGWDKNGIYYFGEKPKKPINWKDYKKGKKSNMITLESYLAEDSLDECGMFVQLDDAMSGMINNVDDDEIDDAVRYFERVAGALGSKNRLSNVQCYFCNADWLNPSEQSYLRSEMKPLYKNGKYGSYVGTYNGKKFIVDKYSNNYDFTIYATDEQTIIDLIKDIEEAY